MASPSRTGAEVIAGAIEAAIQVHRRLLESDLSPVVAAVAAIRGALAGGGRVLVFGNGGSAADAQHFAAELVGRFQRIRAARAAVALSVDTSVLTAIANDEGFERVFARQIEALGVPGDVAFAISTSGASPNVRAGLETARARGLTTVALTGRQGGPIGRAADIHINVPHASAARVQEVHRTLMHAICELVEDGIGPEKG
ncbi:MAG TPA: SIS domain-containing protein [Vicinamibacterales bacterium]|nr:SIS domain-containing protein [Vicinamibacterales bacterium]